MATVDTSTLCGGCLAYANVATVRNPRKLAPPPADSCHDADECRDVELCFNCMGQHLIKDCKANRSTCPIKGCGEHHHVKAHKFISFRRTRRKLHMGPSNLYPVKNGAGNGVAAHLPQVDIDRFRDQCMLWQQDILDREHDSSMTSGTIERLGAEKPDEDEEGYAGMTFFGDDVDFGLMATVDFDPMEAADATIDLGIDEDIVFGDEDEIARFYEDGVPIDEDGPVRLSVHDDSSGSTPLPSDPLIQPPFASAPVPPTRTFRGVSWPNPVAWFGSALVAIGFMIGGSDATTLGAPSLHGGSPSIARDPNSAWNRLQTSRPVGSCCQRGCVG